MYRVCLFKNNDSDVVVADVGALLVVIAAEVVIAFVVVVVEVTLTAEQRVLNLLELQL